METLQQEMARLQSEIEANPEPTTQTIEAQPETLQEEMLRLQAEIKANPDSELSSEAIQPNQQERVAQMRADMKAGMVMPEQAKADPKISAGQSAFQGIISGLNFGVDDEVTAAIRSLTSDESYNDIVTELRQHKKASNEQHPYITMAADTIGSMVGTMGAGGVLKVIGSLLPKGIASNVLVDVGKAIASPTSVRQAIGGGAVVSGSMSAIDGNDIGDITTDAVLGAAMGGSIQGIGNKLLKPTSTRPAELVKEGVNLSPAQRVGGLPQLLEETAAGSHIFGAGPRKALQQSTDSFNKNRIDNALKLIDTKLPDGIEAGAPAIKSANQVIKDAYNRMTPKIKLKEDAQLLEDLRIVDPITRGSLRSRIKRGDSLSDLTGSLQKEIDNPLSKSKRASEVLHSIVKKTAQRQNRGTTTDVGKLDEAFAKLRTVEDAAMELPAAGRVYNPHDYLKAVKKNAPSNRKFSEGDAYDQAFAEKAVDVMTTGDSVKGAPGFAFLNGALAEIAGGLAYAPYTGVGQQLGRGLMKRNATGTLTPSIGAATLQKLADSVRARHQKEESLGYN